MVNTPKLGLESARVEVLTRSAFVRQEGFLVHLKYGVCTGLVRVGVSH